MCFRSRFTSENSRQLSNLEEDKLRSAAQRFASFRVSSLYFGFSGGRYASSDSTVIFLFCPCPSTFKISFLTRFWRCRAEIPKYCSEVRKLTACLPASNVVSPFRGVRRFSLLHLVLLVSTLDSGIESSARAILDLPFGGRGGTRPQRDSLSRSTSATLLDLAAPCGALRL